MRNCEESLCELQYTNNLRIVRVPEGEKTSAGGGAGLDYLKK